MKESTIIHIIDSLGRGGAETLLVGTIRSLSEYNHIIISLKGVNAFEEELKEYDIVYLDFKWYHSIPKCVSKVKTVISKLDNNVIVHSHLFWSNIISRLAANNKIRLVNSYHNVIYGKEGANYPFYALLLDKITYRSTIKVICVSNEVKRNICEYLGAKKNIFTLYNYISDAFYIKQKLPNKIGKKLKIVAVGNIKLQKNYGVVIEAFAALKVKYSDNLFSLDIFGDGPLLEELQEQAELKDTLNIRFMGSSTDIIKELINYDLFLSASLYEGFGISIVEAMAVGLPVMVSNLPVLKEVTNNEAIYFNPLDSNSLAQELEKVLLGYYDLDMISNKLQIQAQKFRKETHLKMLKVVYNSKEGIIPQVNNLY
jgi:glycosyltransferase involved in cell wall biosynthesis